MSKFLLATFFVAVAASAQTDGLVGGPSNDSCFGAIALGLGAHGPFDNVGASLAAAPGFASSGCTPTIGYGDPGSVDYGVADVFYSFTPDATGAVTVSTCRGDAVYGGVLPWLDTLLQVYDSWSCGVGPASMIACSNDAFGTT
jgi:hypothetical protein